MRRTRVPGWWGWPLEFPRHVQERMRQRGFTETDVRHMLFRVRSIRVSGDIGRWLVDAELDGNAWRVVLEPDHQDRVIVVITAFQQGSRQ